LILASPKPFIDVWYFQQRAAELLLHGQNPWAADYTNIYARDDYIGSALLSHGRVLSSPYPPLSLLLSVPGYLAGDVRWSLLASVAGAAALMVAAARRLGLPRGHFSELGAVALLFHARSFFLLEQAWTEPFVALGAAGCIWALAGQRPDVQATAVGVFLSVKQYGLLWLPALWRPARIGARTLAGAIALSATIALPFFVWNPHALWRGVVAFQFEQPFRPDSLSALAMFARFSGTVPWQGLGVVAAVAVALVCAIRAPTDRAGSAAAAALSGAATYLTFFVLEKQAFFNYYWFVCALLAIAITTSARPSAPVVR
jgi:hypothetical protein